MELGLLATEVTFGFVGIVVSSLMFLFALLDFFLSIDPLSTWLLQGEIWNVARSCVGYCLYIKIYKLFKSIIILWVWCSERIFITTAQQNQEPSVSH